MQNRSRSFSSVVVRNPNNKFKFMASYFLNALVRIQYCTSTTTAASSSSSLSSFTQRSRRIKRAAYASMARAVGTRRAWSRALVYRLRRRARARGQYLPVAILQRTRRHRRNHRILSNNRPSALSESCSSSADDLRRLVPGGRGMDMFNLLDETASYVRCLSFQVRLMQTVLDSFSS